MVVAICPGLPEHKCSRARAKSKMARPAGRLQRLPAEVTRRGEKREQPPQPKPYSSCTNKITKTNIALWDVRKNNQNQLKTP